jgi:hypothetical protein
MLRLFRKSTTANNDVMVAEPNPNFKGKTANEIVEEIHETFFTEVDKLLADAKIAKSLDTDMQSLIDKSESLKALGFTSTKEVKECKGEIVRLNTLKEENKAKKNLIEAINYFSFKYPNYKFITEDSVKKICDKYGLIYGTVDKYLGDVPDENLKHIQNFKISKDDDCYSKQWRIEREYMSLGKLEDIVGISYFSFKEYCKCRNFEEKDYDFIHRTYSCPLEIVAPQKDFNLEGVGVKVIEHQIVAPDPIVLKPVVFNRMKYYLIVTAWGLEAADELVINANHN